MSFDEFVSNFKNIIDNAPSGHHPTLNEKKSTLHLEIIVPEMKNEDRGKSEDHTTAREQNEGEQSEERVRREREEQKKNR